MNAVAVCAVMLHQEPTLDAKELVAQSKVSQRGGKLTWIREDEKWVQCLDVDNVGKTFDFQALNDLRRLAVLRVFQGKIVESSLSHLSSLHQLELLVILSDGLPDRGMKWIGTIPNLVKLDVKSASMTRSGLSRLSKNNKLRRLFLYNTELTDKDLGPLHNLKKLDDLVLPKSVSSEEVRRIRSSLKTTRVSQM